MDFRSFRSRDEDVTGLSPEDLPDGSRARISYDASLSGTDAYVILSGDEGGTDPEGVSVTVFTKRDPEEWWYLNLPTVEHALRLGAILPGTLDRVLLSALGFRRTL